MVDRAADSGLPVDAAHCPPCCPPSVQGPRSLVRSWSQAGPSHGGVYAQHARALDPGPGLPVRSMDNMALYVYMV
jgi:hypothetical protein